MPFTYRITGKRVVVRDERGNRIGATSENTAEQLVQDIKLYVGIKGIEAANDPDLITHIEMFATDVNVVDHDSPTE